MSIREKDKLDLELMSYTDIAYEIIKEDKKQYNTPNLFREVCNLLELSEAEFVDMIRNNFDLRPAGIIKMLDLRRPIYEQTAAYGHFGRHDLDLPWEKLDKVEALKKFAE